MASPLPETAEKEHLVVSKVRLDSAPPGFSGRFNWALKTLGQNWALRLSRASPSTGPRHHELFTLVFQTPRARKPKPTD